MQNSEMHEAAIWQEMQETLHESLEMQAQELEMEGGNRSANASAVVIRISLRPARAGEPALIFRSPRAISGAKTDRPVAAPFSGRPVVPVGIREMETGQMASAGAVFVPKKGSQTVQTAIWAGPSGGSPTKTAGDWLRNQLQSAPDMARRLRRIRILAGGKPCDNCTKSMIQRLAPEMPEGSELEFRQIGDWFKKRLAGTKINASFDRDADGRMKANLQVKTPRRQFGGSFGRQADGTFGSNVHWKGPRANFDGQYYRGADGERIATFRGNDRRGRSLNGGFYRDSDGQIVSQLHGRGLRGRRFDGDYVGNPDGSMDGNFSGGGPNGQWSGDFQRGNDGQFDAQAQGSGGWGNADANFHHRPGGQVWGGGQFSNEEEASVLETALNEIGL